MVYVKTFAQRARGEICALQCAPLCSICMDLDYLYVRYGLCGRVCVCVCFG